MFLILPIFLNDDIFIFFRRKYFLIFEMKMWEEWLAVAPTSYLWSLNRLGVAQVHIIAECSISIKCNTDVDACYFFFKLHFPTIIQHKNENADVYCLMVVWWWFPRNVGLLGAVGESLLIICAPSRCRCTLAKCNALQYCNAWCIAALLSCSAFCILSLVSATTILYHLYWQ